MSNETLELMKKHLLKSLPSLTCFICKKIPDPEFPWRLGFRCSNQIENHLVCRNCKLKAKPFYSDGDTLRLFAVQNCLCGFSIGSKACPLYSNMIAMLPFCCKNRKNGCNEILFHEQMTLHLPECGFQTVTCINLKCQEKLPLNDVLDHFKSKSCIYKDENTMDNKISLTLMIGIDGNFWEPIEATKNPLNKPLFYSVGQVSDGIIFLWIYFIGFKEEAERFTYAIEVDQNPTRMIKFVGTVKSIFESSDDIVKKRDAFMIGVDNFRMISNSNDDLDFIYEITDKKAEVKDSDEDSGVFDEP